jgi:hypothetical protein
LKRPKALRRHVSFGTGEKAIISAIIWQAFRDSHSKNYAIANEAAYWLLTWGYMYWEDLLGLHRDLYDDVLDEYLPSHL